MNAALPLLLVVVLLAGCTQTEEAQSALAQAREDLGSAQREAREAKERLDRVRSATILRTESLDVTLAAEIRNGTLRLLADATRAGVPIPAENLTRLPPVVLSHADFRVACDPLACEARLPPDGLSVAWASAPERAMRVDGENGCGGLPDGAILCALPILDREGVEALVTTAASDATA